MDGDRWNIRNIGIRMEIGGILEIFGILVLGWR